MGGGDGEAGMGGEGRGDGAEGGQREKGQWFRSAGETMKQVEKLKLVKRIGKHEKKLMQLVCR